MKLRSTGNPATRHRSIELALRKHIIDQGGRGHVAYENLALKYGAAHGIGGGSTHHITVRNCDIAYIGGGHQFTRPDGKPVRFGNGVEFWSGARDCLVEDCRLWEIYDAALKSDHNFWFQSEGPMALWRDEKIDASGFLESQRQRGMDAHSLVADPKFLDATRHDYRLAPDSPARALTNEGRAVGALP